MVDSSMLAAVSVVIAEGKRPVSFRTRKLSPPAPMVLHSGGCGRVGRRRTQRDRKPAPRNRGGLSAFLRFAGDAGPDVAVGALGGGLVARSEEHTSELQ